MQISKSDLMHSSGSAMVESAIVFPVIILSVIAIICAGIKLAEKVRVRANSQLCVREVISPDISAESILRMKWVISKEKLTTEN